GAQRLVPQVQVEAAAGPDVEAGRLRPARARPVVDVAHEAVGAPEGRHVGDRGAAGGELRHLHAGADVPAALLVLVDGHLDEAVVEVHHRPDRVDRPRRLLALGGRALVAHAPGAVADARPGVALDALALERQRPGPVAELDEPGAVGDG